MSIFGKASKNKNQYRQLNQDDISDADDETVIFRKSGDQLELNLLPNGSHSKKHGPGVVRKTISQCQYLGLIVLLVVILGCIASLSALFVKLYWDNDNGTQTLTQSKVPIKGSDSSLDSGSKQQVIHDTRPLGGQEEQHGQTENWKVTFTETGGEGGLRLLDVDGDGKDDVMFGTADAKLIADVMDYKYTLYSDMEKYCTIKGTVYPCIGAIVAMRGYDGKELYRMKTGSEVFVINCDGFDMDKDGKPDCVGTGRQGVVVAFNPYKGETYWTADDKSGVNANWNSYQALALPDWDGDDIPDVLLTNGGDPKRDPEDHNRESGRVIALSGGTGRPLGTRYLSMPDSKETYMSPVIYRPPDATPGYILFGSGGETVPGDLLAISMVDYCHYIMGPEGDKKACPQGDPEGEEFWHDVKKDDNGIFVLYKGERKGVMVPPVVVDVDMDGIDDMVVSVYDGAVILINGRTLNISWRTEFPDRESYSSPAPGYFDDDDTLDFMIHWCDGAWPHYAGSNVTVISGKNGSKLWTMESSFMQMTSDLTISTNQKHRDMFLFRQQGRGSKFRWNKEGEITRLGTKRSKRHFERPVEMLPNQTIHETVLHSYKRNNLACDDDLSSYQGEVFVIDRTIMDNPVRVLTIPTGTYTYDVPPPRPDSDSGHSHGLVPARHMIEGGGHVPKRHARHADNNEGHADDKGKTCTVMTADVRSTGGIGDLDGDGNLDYVSLVVFSIMRHDAMYSYVDMTMQTEIQKINLETGILDDQLKQVPVTAETLFNFQKSGLETIKKKQKTFLPPEQQTWTQYLGRHGDNRYPKRT